MVGAAGSLGFGGLEIWFLFELSLFFLGLVPLFFFLFF